MVQEKIQGRNFDGKSGSDKYVQNVGKIVVINKKINIGPNFENKY